MQCQNSDFLDNVKDIVHTVTYLTRIPQNITMMCWVAESYDVVLHTVIPNLSRNITSHLFPDIFTTFIFSLHHNEPYNLHILYTHLDETMATE